MCSVDSRLTVQVTDNALSRDLFPRDYDCLGDNDNRPIKWLAIEALTYRQFSAATDMVHYIPLRQSFFLKNILPLIILYK